MNYLFTVYDPDTGRIIQAGRASNEPLALMQGDHVLLGIQGDREAQYVIDGALADRPTIPDLDNVPAGTRVIIDGVDHGICDDGTVDVETDIPGTYAVHLVPPFPYQPLETEVVVE